jgi:hypothetical protein
MNLLIVQLFNLLPPGTIKDYMHASLLDETKKHLNIKLSIENRKHDYCLRRNIEYICIVAFFINIFNDYFVNRIELFIEMSMVFIEMSMVVAIYL